MQPTEQPAARRGHFSHIFVDEAGEAMVGDVLIPLSLAADSTTVVLAGERAACPPITLAYTNPVTTPFNHSPCLHIQPRFPSPPPSHMALAASDLAVPPQAIPSSSDP